jgi:hypothetical protein
MDSARPLSSFADTSGILLDRWLTSGASDFELYLRAVGDAARSGTTQERFDTAYSTPLLPCQTEHYNLVAGQINGTPNLAVKVPMPVFSPTAQPGWVPSYNPQNVPGPVGYTTAFPRTCFYSWLAPASGPDPIADYLTGRGATVRNTLPDGYGTPITYTHTFLNANLTPKFYYVDEPGAYSDGFDPAMQATIALYRWIDINDARTIYANFNLPFVLNRVAIPLKFVVVKRNVVVTLFSVVQQPHAPINPPDTWVLLGQGPDIELDGANVTGFTNNASGGWARFVSSPVSMTNAYRWWADGTSQHRYGLWNYPSSGGPNAQFADYGTYFEWGELVEQSTFNWAGGGTTVRAVSNADDIKHLIIIRENCISAIAAMVPVNGPLTDLSFAAANQYPMLSLGPAILPAVADALTENNAPITSYIDGTGGAGAYETLISCTYIKALFSVVDVDGLS